MVLKNVSYIKIEEMDTEQRKELSITQENGLVAIETHNSDYTTKAVVIGDSIIDYILEE